MTSRPAKPGHHGGAGNCLACSLPEPDQTRLNADLVAGVQLYRLAKKWNINRASLRAHKDQHISPAETALTAARTKDSPVVGRVEELVQRTDAMYESARAAGNIVLGLKALGLQAHALELLAKLRGELDERPTLTINVQSTQEWVDLREVVFAFIPANRREELSRRLELLDGGKA